LEKGTGKIDRKKSSLSEAKKNQKKRAGLAQKKGRRNSISRGECLLKLKKEKAKKWEDSEKTKTEEEREKKRGRGVLGGGLSPGGTSIDTSFNWVWEADPAKFQTDGRSSIGKKKGRSLRPQRRGKNVVQKKRGRRSESNEGKEGVCGQGRTRNFPTGESSWRSGKGKQHLTLALQGRGQGKIWGTNEGK